MADGYHFLHKMYHITKESNLDSIMRSGLIPSIGDNCKLFEYRHHIHEPQPMVFFSPEEHLWFFSKCFTNEYNIFLEVDLYELYYEKALRLRRNSVYTEYGCSVTVDPKYILGAYKIIDKNKHEFNHIL